MADPLRPMKMFLGKTMVCFFLAVLPIVIMEGMWSNPDSREVARTLEGSSTTWIVIAFYILAVILIWCRWVNRP